MQKKKEEIKQHLLKIPFECNVIVTWSVHERNNIQFESFHSYDIMFLMMLMTFILI